MENFISCHVFYLRTWPVEVSVAKSSDSLSMRTSTNVKTCSFSIVFCLFTKSRERIAYNQSHDDRS